IVQVGRGSRQQDGDRQVSKTGNLPEIADEVIEIPPHYFRPKNAVRRCTLFNNFMKVLSVAISILSSRPAWFVVQARIRSQYIYNYFRVCYIFKILPWSSRQTSTYKSFKVLFRISR